MSGVIGRLQELLSGRKTLVVAIVAVGAGVAKAIWPDLPIPTWVAWVMGGLGLSFDRLGVAKAESAAVATKELVEWYTKQMRAEEARLALREEALKENAK